MRAKYRAILTLTILLGVQAPALAIVNIEGQRIDPQQQGLSGTANLSFSAASGNTNKTNASVSSRVHWQHKKSNSLFIIHYRYGESNQLRNTNKAFAHLRHIFQLNDTRAIEIFIQAERDEFTRLSLRTLAGLGLRQTIHQTLNAQIQLGLGGFYSSEMLEQHSELNDNGTDSLWRTNAYLSIHYVLSKQLTINSTGYYQPALENRHDYRLLEQASLTISLSNQLALKLSLDISHDSQPPQGIESTDVSYHSGIEYQF